MLTRSDKSLLERGWVEYRSEDLVTYKHPATKVEVTFKPANQVVLRIGVAVSTYDLQCAATETFLDRLSRVLAKEEHRLASRIVALALEVEELCAARQHVDPAPWREEMRDMTRRRQESICGQTPSDDTSTLDPA